MVKKKVKRYSGEDGESEVVDMRDRKEDSTGIDDSARARARRFLETNKKDFDTDSEPVRAKAKPKMTKSVAKEEPTKSVAKEEPKNFRMPDAEPGLERVMPELDLLPIGKVAGALSAGYMAARGIGKHILGKRAAAEAAEKAADMFAKRSAAIKEGFKNKSDRIRSSGAMEGDFKVSDMRTGYKKGGKVAGKLATRGYGKAR